MTESSPPSSYTLLRIKRKATDAPLSSLVIQDGAGNPAKRRREVMPLGRSRGVFRLAETVPDTWVGEGQEGVVLRERIKGLLSAKTDTSPLPSPGAGSSKTVPDVFSKSLAAPDTKSPAPEPISPREAAEKGDLTDPPMPSSPSTSARRKSSTVGKRAVQYRVVQPPPARPTFGLPPRVMTIAEEERLAREKQFNFVDAEAISSASSSRKPSLPSAEEQKEMAPFLSMLEDVLHFESPAKPSVGSSSRTTGEDAETYVYDLYYKDNRPDPGTSTSFGVGDGVHIGALLGYGSDDEDDFEAISEPEDEADEDSNEEDYYRNDYPEDEDADEDMEGFKDAFDDDDDDDAGRSDDDARGLWDYR